MDGIIDGGWGFVIAAYGITWTVLLGYAATLVLRSKGLSDLSARQSGSSSP